jgi:sulfonate transport system ATP-binding protein
MAPRPGRIKRIVDVALPRPRERNDPRFIRLRDEVLADFAEHDSERGGANRDDNPHGGTPVQAVSVVPGASAAPAASPPITEWRLAW